MIRGVKFATISVRDQDRALAFYTSVLGFALVTDQPFDDTQRWIELRIGGADTKLVLFTPPGQEDRVGGFAPFALWADNVERTYETLAARGVEFLGPPKKADWGTSVMFKDSEGNTLIISSK